MLVMYNSSLSISSSYTLSAINPDNTIPLTNTGNDVEYVEFTGEEIMALDKRINALACPRSSVDDIVRYYGDVATTLIYWVNRGA